ncbi:hypothetical protein JXL83_02100 [candidate division WOR-3 bacterium]|nr:hypothetical protein [candidate division WOR-3 bacterium]
MILSKKMNVIVLLLLSTLSFSNRLAYAGFYTEKGDDDGTAHLVQNGDFEAGLEQGWIQTASGGFQNFTRETALDPDPDYEVKVVKDSSSGYSMLYQTVPIRTTDLTFSADVKFDVFASYSAWTGAALDIEYLDRYDSFLGRTRICRKTERCRWVDTTYMDVIEVQDGDWHSFSFSIDSELINVPSVNPVAVDKIKLVLLDTVRYC